MDGMKPNLIEWDDEPGIFDEADERLIAEADARALADVKAGRFISNEAMVAWLKSWGAPDELPPPQCGE